MMTKLPNLNIGNLNIPTPFILGGMGVGISNSTLAAACANEGMAGTIAAGGLCGSGYREEEYVLASNKALIREIRAARELSNGVIGVNCMFALTNYDELVRVAVAENVDYIISGAGLPLYLPEIVDNPSIKLIPVVSSGRATEIICHRWKTRYNRLPDAVVVEGAQAGGHLGVKYDEIKNWNQGTIVDVCKEVIEALKQYQTPEHHIPVVAAGGIYGGVDIANVFKIGVEGVQIATRFIATHECPLSDIAKQSIVDSTIDDMILIKSPVGMPGRALKNKFIEQVQAGKTIPKHCFYHCLKTCDPVNSPYCIATALFNAIENNFERSIVMVGYNAYRIDKILSVKELVNELVNEAVLNLG